MIADILCPFQGQEISAVPREMLSKWVLQIRKKYAIHRGRIPDHVKRVIEAVEEHLQQTFQESGK